MTETDLAAPWWVADAWAPVSDELSAFDLCVTGDLPTGLDGTFVRIGPNPAAEPPMHPFLGDGMLHAVNLSGGRAVAYRNRWVRTRQLERAPRLLPDGRRDITVGPANTSVLNHGGRILALNEQSLPVEVTAQLETVALYDFDGRLTTGMTAHPKVCPLSGELHFYGYDVVEPYLTYHRADAEGRLVESVPIELPGPRMVHEMAITTTAVVFFDLPVVFDVALALAGRVPYRWDDALPARIGLMDRADQARAVRWFELPPCFTFHVFGAYEDGGRVVIDLARYDRMFEDPYLLPGAHWHRWTVDRRTGVTTDERLDDLPIEFTRIDDRRMGLPYRWGYALETKPSDDGDTFSGTALVRYDMQSGSAERHDFGPGRIPGEGVFVADPEGDGEADGWVLTYVQDMGTGSSELAVLASGDFSGEPVASVQLPRRVPTGFHAAWLPSAAGVTGK